MHEVAEFVGIKFDIRIMEVREFAEKVLFSESLDEKLSPPSNKLTDEIKGEAIVSPTIPGRPDELIPSKREKKNAFPSIHNIESSDDRAKLLHFLANHELIAAELMALVLLKFPQAPTAFREGILKTLIEEQHHTLWYMKRMKSLGIKFGDQPVNGFIWNNIKDMVEPIDFVSRLSLTFEQANLDYSKFYAKKFHQCGDSITARIFEKIYRDEIEHVNHGLHWFRLWKDQSKSDWEEWNKRLIFPLSPMRAKGGEFNRQGRRSAGLDKSYIDELSVYAKSRGRTPILYFYNPDAELEMASHGPYHPSKRITKLIHDLEILPAFLSGIDDIVLVNKIPSRKHKERLQNSGFQLPQFELINDGKNLIPDHSELLSRKLGGFRPWAVTEESLRIIRRIGDSSKVGDNKKLHGQFNDVEDELKNIYSKQTGNNILNKFLESDHCDGFRDLMIEKSQIGKTVMSVDKVMEQVNSLKSEGFKKFVVKCPFGAAGGNQLRLWDDPITQRQINWIENAIRVQGKVVIEPWHERVLDFSIQMEIKSKSPKVVGWTILKNDHRGQFEGIQFPFRLALAQHPKLAKFINYNRKPGSIKNVLSGLVEFVNHEFSTYKYKGPLGIDAYFYTDPDGELRLRPLVEINSRYTMGRLALEIGAQVQGGKISEFKLYTRSQIKTKGYSTFCEFDKVMSQQNPIVFSGNQNPQISSGYISLNDPEAASSILATLTVNAG